MFWETYLLAQRAIRRNAMRSSLTVLGIVIGVAAVIAMVTLGSGATAKVTADIARLGSNMLHVRPGQGMRGPGGARASAAPFKIDDAELRAQVTRLEAERDLAVQALERTRRLLAQNASSEADLELAEANARSSQAQLELEQVRLDRTLVRAPFSGSLGERLVSLGDYVNTSTRLTTLQTVDPQRAVFQVPERYARRLEVGQEVSFRVAALPDVEFFGSVDFVDPVVALPARTIKVKAEVPNRERTLKAGMFIEARLATDVRPAAIVVPEDAILPLSGANYVWVIVDGTATRRQVELGVRIPGFVEIESGVEAGEQVVVGGLERLSEGTPVVATVVER